MMKKHISGSMVVNWPGETFNRKTTNNIDVTNPSISLSIPAEYKPDASKNYKTIKNVNGKSKNFRISSTLYVHIKLENLTQWIIEPPIDSEAKHEIKIYGSSDDHFKKWRNNKREYKRVRITNNQPYLTTYSAWRRQFDNKYGYLKEMPKSFVETSVFYARDHDLGDLHRYSYLRCYKSIELKPSVDKPGYKGWLNKKNQLKHKLADDFSPEGCVLNRAHTKLISPPETPIDDWVYIECRLYSRCTVSMQAAKRKVVVDLFFHDIAKWRETIDPVRAKISSFEIDTSAKSLSSN